MSSTKPQHLNTGQPCEDEPDTACPDTENPDMDNPCLENRPQLNKDKRNTDLSSTKGSNPILSNLAGANGTGQEWVRELSGTPLENIKYMRPEYEATLPKVLRGICLSTNSVSR